MECQGCNGKILGINDGTDVKGVCLDCRGLYLKNKRTKYATKWCACRSVPVKEQQYYFCDIGSHGWLHSTCKQVTQTG